MIAMPVVTYSSQLSLSLVDILAVGYAWRDLSSRICDVLSVTQIDSKRYAHVGPLFLSHDDVYS